MATYLSDDEVFGSTEKSNSVYLSDDGVFGSEPEAPKAAKPESAWDREQRQSAIMSGAGDMPENVDPVTGPDERGVPAMTAGSVARDVFSGALQIGPTAVKGVADIGRLLTGDRVGTDLSNYMEEGMKSTREVIGSKRAQVQRDNFAKDMKDENVGIVEALARNKGALADMALPTIGSMILPVGVAGAAGKLATVGKAAKSMEAAQLAARVSQIQSAAGVSTIAAQNAADTFTSLIEDGVSMEEAYLGAGISVPFSLLASKLTGGGAEMNLIRKLTGSKVGGKIGQSAVAGVAKAGAREGGQEAGEEVGQILGDAAGYDKLPTANEAGKRLAVAGTLGAVMGSGVDVASGGLGRAGDRGLAVDVTYQNEAGETVTSTGFTPAQTERQRLEAMRATKATADTVVADIKDQAVADIGAQTTVDDAINSAQRAVNLDSNVLMDQVLEQAGMTQADLQQAEIVAAQPLVELAPIDSALTEDAQQAPSEAAPQAPAATPDTVVWTGRRGDGYATEADVGNALRERQRLRPNYEWQAKQNAEGRWVLEGQRGDQAAVQQAPQNVAQASSGLKAAYTTSAAAYAAAERAGVPRSSINVTETANGFTIAPTQERETIRALRDQSSAVQRLSAAVQQMGGAPGGVELYTGPMSELGVGREGSARTTVGEAAQIVDVVGSAVNAAFGWKPVPVTGLDGIYGAQYQGRVYVNLDEAATGDQFGNTAQGVIIQSIGHETTHNLEKSQDPADQALYASLRAAIIGNAKPGPLADRVTQEGRGQTYGENEVVADVSGSFWLDRKFWSRLYDLDNGSTMRRIAYKFMENAAKLVDAVKGSRLDAARYLNDGSVDAVREVAAQVWAQKGKNGSLFSGESSERKRDGAGAKPQNDSGPADVSFAKSGQGPDATGAQRAGAGDQGASRIAPLAGAPKAGPDPRLVGVAEQYARNNGIDLRRQAEYVQVDPARAKRIAEAYEAMPHAPNDPRVKAAYAELIKQTTAQYRALEDAGYKFWFFDETNDPYNGNPWDAMRDLRNTQSMAVFATDAGFGSSDLDVSDNPLLATTGIKWPSGSIDGPLKPVLANDLFRAVHDAFGHGLEGAGFRAQGEENAWQSHVRLFTGDAVGAITTETRGQNSALNFGPNGGHNQTAKVEDTIFADQKTGLLPEWTWTEGRADDKAIGQTNFEVAPDPSNVELAARWKKMSTADKAEVSVRIAKDMVPKVLEASGATGTITEQIGSYEKDTNTSFALKITSGNLDQVSKNIGFVLSQDSMVSLSAEPFEGGEKVGAVIVDVGNLTFNEVQALYDGLSEAVPSVGGQSTSSGLMTILNYSDLSTADLAAAVSDVIGERYPVYEHEVYSSFPEKEDYNYASPENNAGGKGALGEVTRQRLVDLRAEATAAINQALPSFSRRPDAGSNQAGGADTQRAGRPSYGIAQKGSTSVVGVHYSKQPRNFLDGIFYGTGLKGAEAKRLEGQSDIRPRVFFYVDAGAGVSPEGGVGSVAHEVQLNNLYDVVKDELGIVKNATGPDDRASNWERAVMKAGFDGYYAKTDLDVQGYAVLVGQKQKAIPVRKAEPRVFDEKSAVRRTAPAEQKKSSARVVGDNLVRRPVGQEVMQIIAARKAGLEMVAPSFKMEFGEAKVLASEAALANQVLAEHPGGFTFGGAAATEASAPAKETAQPAQDSALESAIKSGDPVSLSRVLTEQLNQNDQTQTESFKNWFGDSAVVDAKGKPLVVYHGTTADISEFDPSKGKVVEGIFMTPSTSYANTMAGGGDGDNVMPLYASIKNPRYISAEDWSYDSLTSAMSDGRHDGVIVTNEDGSIYVVVVHEPTQIKSAIGNSGAFDPANPDIRFSKSEERTHGLVPKLLDKAPARIKLPGKPLLTQATTNKNAQKQIDNIDVLLKKFQNPEESVDAWNTMMSYALNDRAVPIAPFKMIERLKDGSYGKLLGSLSEGQIADANHGFEGAAKMRALYESGQADVRITGKLALWSFLSRGVSPYAQESLFLDAVDGIGPWIERATNGNFGPVVQEQYKAWADKIATAGSGRPGLGSKHNLNAFGTSFLAKMSERGEDGRTRLQLMHDLVSDFSVTGPEVRREFAKFGEGVGIDNKVVSFMMLVSGRDDVLVLDRVQIRGLWNDGRFDDYNLYDGVKQMGPNGKAQTVPGTGIAGLFSGARGLAIYEALERAIGRKVTDYYAEAGRPQDASLGRFHWETWVSYSGQEASHGTIAGIIADAEGQQAPYTDITAKEGEYGAYAYGSAYGIDSTGMPYMEYQDSNGTAHRFNIPAYREFMESVKAPKNKVVKSGFKVSKDKYGRDRTEPWFKDSAVNREILDGLIQKFGRPSEGNLSLDGGQPNADGAGPDGVSFSKKLPDGVAITEVDGGFDAMLDGKRIGRLRDNLPRGMAEKLDETANVDIVKVDKEFEGKGVGSALYAAFNDKHGGRIAPSGKTSPEAWALWKRNYPEKVAEFAASEAARIRDGADAQMVIRNITDAEVAREVAESVSFSRKSLPLDVWAKDEPVVFVDEVNSKISGLGVKVHLATTFADLPQNIQDAAQDAGVSSTAFRGVTIGGDKVFVVQNNHSDIKDLQATVVHEVYGHIGLRALFGTGIYRRLNKLYLSLGEAKFNALSEKYGLRKNGYFEMAEAISVPQDIAMRAGGKAEAKQAWLMEELLAHIAESETGTVRQQAREIVGAIRNWLRVNGFAKLANLGMSDIAHILKTGRTSLETQKNFDGADNPPSFSRVSSKAGDRFTLKDETPFEGRRRKWQDYFLRGQTVRDMVGKQGGLVDDTTDFYQAEALSHGRKSDMAKEFGRQSVEPLMKRMAKEGVEFEELSMYAYAMHAPERNAQIASIDRSMPDGGSGMTNAEAANIIQMVDLAGDKAKFDSLHAELMEITKGTRELMESEGLITPAERAALEQYDNYIPLRGFEAVDEQGEKTGLSAGRGINVRGKETMRALGRKSKAGQLIENTISDRVRAIDRTERNQVGKVFLNFVLQNPDTKLWEIDATKTRKSFDKSTGRVARSTTIDTGPDTVSVKVGGHEIYIKVKDEMLVRALRKAHKDDTGENERALINSIGLYTSLLRNTLTRYNPEFALNNAARDYGFGSTAILAELGEKGVAKFNKHYPGALGASSRYERNKLDANTRDWDKWFNEYKAAGGITGGFYQKDLDQISSDIRGMMVEAGSRTRSWQEKAKYNPAVNGLKSALRVLEYAGSVSENAARVSAYRTAREMGKTPSQAALIAKNLTTNFDRKGEYGQLTNSLYVFYNAAVQSTHALAKMLQSKKVWGYMAGITGASIASAMAMATIGGDDPDDDIAYWDKIPQYVKERNFVIMLPPGDQMEGAERVGTRGRYMLIPVQYGLNIFHYTGYQIADLARNLQDKTRGITPAKAGINIGSALAGSFNPFGGSIDLDSQSDIMQAILPSVGDVVVQFATGTDGFGREVAPFKSPFDSKPDSQNSNVRQAGGPAEKVAQLLNRATGGSEYESGKIDVSAGTIQNIVSNATGGTGKFIYDGIALAGKALDHFQGEAPDVYPRDIPIVRRVYGETGGDTDQGIFYENRKEIQEAAGVDKRMKDADVELTDGKKLALSSMNKDASKVTRQLSQIRREMAEVQRNEEISKLEKRARIRELKIERDTLTQEFNKDFMAVMRDALNAKDR